jgi:hypothetical protein
MPDINIKPQAVLLTSGQAVTFRATVAGGEQPGALNQAADATLAAGANDVKWNLTPPFGTLAPQSVVDQTPSASAIYVAPQVDAARTIAVIASKGNDSASATISLTPDAISIVPAKVELKAEQSQQFNATVAGVPDVTKDLTWTLSPSSGLGSLNKEGLYAAPADIRDAMTVTVIATSNGKQALATVNLISPPWTGRGVQFLGVFLLLVFALVYPMILLWPPAVPSPDAAKANRIEAEKTKEEKETVLRDAEKELFAANKNLATAHANAKLAKKTANTQAGRAGTPSSSVDENEKTVEEAQAEAEVNSKSDAQKRADQAQRDAAEDLKNKRSDEQKANASDVETILAHKINRELDLLCLVLLAGALGAFLHMAQSFTDYIGNRTLKGQWASWYYFRPFIGAGLAFVLYALVRGGFMAIATGTNAKASELNPFGLVGVAALAGMFSKAATMKLGEVFDTLFKTKAAEESKDKLVKPSATVSQPAASTNATTGSAATK